MPPNKIEEMITLSIFNHTRNLQNLIYVSILKSVIRYSLFLSLRQYYIASVVIPLHCNTYISLTLAQGSFRDIAEGRLHITYCSSAQIVIHRQSLPTDHIGGMGRGSMQQCHHYCKLLQDILGIPLIFMAKMVKIGEVPVASWTQ